MAMDVNYCGDHFAIQAYLEGIAGSVSDHSNKANIIIKWVTQIFLVHVKVIFTLYYSLSRVQQQRLKKQCTYVNKKYHIAKKC